LLSISVTSWFEPRRGRAHGFPELGRSEKLEKKKKRAIPGNEINSLSDGGDLVAKTLS